MKRIGPPARENQLERLQSLGLFGLKANSISGREFVSLGKTFVDYCQTNYLSFDFDEKILSRGFEYASRWGSLTPTSRMEVDPEIYGALESRIAAFIGGDKVHLGHTVTQVGFSLIPAIVERGIIFADAKLHTVVWEACRLARDHGAQVVRFAHQSLEDLERLLREHRHVKRKLIAVDGIYSISTEAAPVVQLQALCEEYDAYLYVDDAHGFGILGKSPDAQNPYGVGGSGLLDFAGAGRERIFYASSFGKAFCTPVAFICVPSEFRENLDAVSLHYLFSAPVSPFHVGMANGVLDRNREDGESRRLIVRQRVEQFVAGLQKLRVPHENNFSHPVVYLPVGSIDSLVAVGRACKEAGILPGFRAYPVTPADRCGLRFAFSSMHTEKQVADLLEFISDCISRALIRVAEQP